MAGEVRMPWLLRQLSAKEFRNWMLFEQIEPYGGLRGDLQVASVVQMIANVNRGKDQEPYKLKDFLLRFGEEPIPEKPKGLSPEQQDAVLRALFVAYSANAIEDEKSN
jgi:hypothetical protein